jgi:hypothetical protein
LTVRRPRPNVMKCIRNVAPAFAGGYVCQGYLEPDIKTPATPSSNSLAWQNALSEEDERPNQALIFLNSISSLPPGTISSSDQSIIEVYFTRRLTDLIISPEFVEEMNFNVLKVFYNDSEAVCDPLSAIGQIYMGLVRIIRTRLLCQS